MRPLVPSGQAHAGVLGAKEVETDDAMLYVILAGAVAVLLAVAVAWFAATCRGDIDPERGGWCPSCRRLGLPGDYYCRRCGRMLRRRV